MTFAEYDYDMDIAVQRQEAFEDGQERGAYDARIETACALLADGDTVEKASRISGLPFDEVQQFQIGMNVDL